MYEYKYVSVRSSGVVAPEFQGNREIIDRYAAEGWRYAGWTPVITTQGILRKIDLIFEREK